MITVRANPNVEVRLRRVGQRRAKSETEPPPTYAGVGRLSRAARGLQAPLRKSKRKAREGPQ